MKEERPQSQLAFYDCSSCGGFGYQITGSKKHIRCTHCHDHPSMYAILNDELLYWGIAISHHGVTQRRWLERLSMAFHAFLLFICALGVAAVAFVALKQLAAGGTLIDVFATPHPLMAFFWWTVSVAFFLYYRLDREAASKKEFNTDKYAEKKKHGFKRPIRPDFDKLHHFPHHVKTEISAYFTRECIQVIDASYDLTKKLDHHQITPLHILGALTENPTIQIILARIGISASQIYEKIGKAMGAEGITSGDGLDLGLEANRIFFHAYEEALRKGRHAVDVMELFTVLIREDRWVNEIFYALEIEDQTVENVVEWIHIQNGLRRRFHSSQRKRSRKPKGIMNRSMTARPSPLLESISQDYTSIARIGGFFPLVGRKKEMDQMLRILRERTGNILLVGPSGTGKTTLFEGLADLMAAEDVPPELQDKRLVVLDPGALIADAKGVGEVEGRIGRVIREILMAGNIVLGIEDIHHLLNMRSTSGSEDVGSILMNALSKGLVKVVATTTTPEYQQFIVNHGPFLRRFQVVKMEEMSRNDAIMVLEAKAGSLEYKHRVFFTYAAIESIVDLSIRFIQDRYLPAKALDIMSEVAAFAESPEGGRSIVTKEHVAQVISEKTNVQVTSITEDEREKLLHLEELMHQRIVGQNEAVDAVASALRRAREGLRDTGRPIASFLFLGPTGVGKTEMAKTIAEVYFGSESNMIRLDMSEYQDVSSLRKLIGGKGEQGQLTDAIRLKPFSLVLLDELEKAHPDVLNVFLQVLDDGRITDGTGQTFDMSNTMIIATSNAATQQIQNSIAAGLSVDVMKTQLLEEVLPKFFRPEFINRFDNVIVFTPLTFEEVVEIAQRLMTNVGKKLLDEKGILMDVEGAAILEIAQKGYHPLYGARPLRRVIQDTVDDALSKLLLSQQIGRRDLVILHAGGEMEVKKAMTL